MKYTTKMILVLEDVYKELVAAAASKQPKTTMIKLESAEEPAVEKQLIAQTKKTMKKIARNRRSNPDERQIRLMQEFKRYKKLKSDLDEKLSKVHVYNLEALIEEEKKRENDQAKRSLLKRQLSEFQHNQELPAMENWDHQEAFEEEEREEEEENPPIINKYRRKKIPSPNKIQLQARLKPSAKAKPYPDIANAPIPAVARQQLFSAWRENNDYRDANNLVTPRAFKPQLWG